MGRGPDVVLCLSGDQALTKAFRETAFGQWHLAMSSEPFTPTLVRRQIWRIKDEQIKPLESALVEVLILNNLKPLIISSYAKYEGTKYETDFSPDPGEKFSQDSSNTFRSSSSQNDPFLNPPML
jgi:hypothetical protein